MLFEVITSACRRSADRGRNRTGYALGIQTVGSGRVNILGRTQRGVGNSGEGDGLAEKRAMRGTGGGQFFESGLAELVWDVVGFVMGDE